MESKSAGLEGEREAAMAETVESGDEEDGVLFVDGEDEEMGDAPPPGESSQHADEEATAKKVSLSPVSSSASAPPRASHRGVKAEDRLVSSDNSESGEEEEETEEEDGESDDDDDPVVREIDVYVRRLDTSSAASVYVLQYPLRPLYRPYGDHGQLLEVAYRERQRTLQFTYGLHTAGENFDPSHPMNVEAERAFYATAGADDRAGPDGVSSGAGALGGSPQDRRGLERERAQAHEVRPKHILKSQRALAGDCSYAVGILKKNKLFITPVDHVLQFRPDFTPIDRLQQNAAAYAASGSGGRHAFPSDASSARKKGGDAERDERPEPGTGAAAERGAGAMFAANLGEGRAKISHSRQRDIEESEEWLSLETFYDADTSEALDIIRTLCSTQVEAEEDEEKKTSANSGEDLLADLSASAPTPPPASAASAVSAGSPLAPAASGSQDILFVSNTRGYLRSLCGTAADRSGAASGSAQSASQATGPLGYGALAKLSPDQQVFTILRHRHVESFATIQRLLTTPMSEADLLRILLQYAVLVLGNWAIKSMYVYDDMYEISCRDLLLALLIRSGATSAAPSGRPGEAFSPPSSVGLPKEAFRSATRLPAEKVTLMLQEVAVCSSSAWRLKLPPDSAFLAAHPSIQKHFDLWWKQRLQQVVKEVHQRRDARKQPPRLLCAADEGKAAVVSPALLQLAGRLCASSLKTQGAQTFKQLREMLNGKNQDFVGITDRDLERVLQTVAVQVGTVWLSPKVGNPQIDLYRDSLISILKSQTAPHSKAQIVQELAQALNRHVDLPDFTLRKLLRELAVNEGGFWAFKGRVKETQDAETDV
ncbi:DNA-directed RNA polymerase III RPC5 [Besnoitia besnoiti]|uniref:DNA-directed RNA polymerase III RPC5 n=1 Tax=Besnoitia besnoiti TaxID=94643 RepID=A0A2A9MKR7_BESBE|nr:DNA-directed RNA polymerase III RPC5 [Besnoitia besnoiti]PFH36596.1 DNA-directed RNA polymerase III RPC5 [Besnoitia besnoiti]